jgi:mono/diheme cytochrome c family protein
MRRKLAWIGTIAMPFIVVGGLYLMSRDRTARNIEWPSQMQYPVAYKSQSLNPVMPSGITQQAPPAGTIPRGFKPFHYGPGPDEALRAGRELTNPFQPASENLARGKQVFLNNCIVCHGPNGNGDGPIIPKYPNPPSFRTDQSRALPDGQMFHIITMGRNNMPSHAAQVASDDRWKVILYIRTLQKKS